MAATDVQSVFPTSASFPTSAFRSAAICVFTAWARSDITGDEKGAAQIFINHLFRAFVHPGLHEIYHTLALQGANSLEDVQPALDTTDLVADGFYTAKNLLAQFLPLNQSIANNIESGTPATAPGLPADAQSRTEFITANAIHHK